MSIVEDVFLVLCSDDPPVSYSLWQYWLMFKNILINKDYQLIPFKLREENENENSIYECWTIELILPPCDHAIKSWIVQACALCDFHK